MGTALACHITLNLRSNSMSRRYWITDLDGTYEASIGFIIELGLLSEIENVIRFEGRRSLDLNGLVYGGLPILRVQWQ